MQHVAGRAVALSVAALLSMASTAPAAWATEEAEFPFVLRTDYALDDARAMLDELRELGRELVQALGIDEAEDWIEIYVYRDRNDFADAAKEILPGAEPRSALFVQGRGRAMVLTHRSERLSVDLRHEATHALLHQYAPELPLWLDEGLAEYFEESSEYGEEQSSHLHAIRMSGGVDSMPTLKELEAKSELADLSSRDYAAAWCWAHFLINGPPELRAELRSFLADSGERRDKLAFGERLRRIDPAVEESQRAAAEKLISRHAR